MPTSLARALDESLDQTLTRVKDEGNGEAEFLLLESSDFILLEDGSKILLESSD